MKLETVFTLFEKSKLKLKPSKCFFLFNEINFLGHIVSDKGICTQPAKVKTISELQIPKTVKQLQRFLGMTVYYSKFIESYSTLAYPLYQLLRTEEKVIKNWTEICQKSFDEIKLRLNKAPVLIHYNNQKTVYLRFDCSNTASGLILLQEGEDGELHPLTFYSKVLKPHQHKYSTTYKEYLSVLYATRLYRNYLLDKKFVVLTDHKPLLRAKNFKPDNRQLSQLDLLLSEFDFDVNYVTAKNVADADCLSRLTPFNTRKIKNNKYIEIIEVISDQQLNSNSVNNCEMNCNFCRFTDNLSVSQSYKALPFDIIAEQNSDNYTKTIIDILSTKGKTNPKTFEKVSHFYIVLNNMLYRRVGKNQNERYCLVIPQKVQEFIIKTIHSIVAAHLGINKCLDRIKRFYWFERMEEKIVNFIKTCTACQKAKPRNHKIYSIPKCLPIEKIPFTHIYLDIFGPIQESSKKNSFVIVCVEPTTRYIITSPITTTSAAQVLRFMRDSIIHNYGLPMVITTDNASCFTGDKFKEFCAKCHITHKLITPYTPTANSYVERVIQTITTSLKTYCTVKSIDWETHLKAVTHAINNTKHKSTGFTPHFLLHGYNCRSFLENQLEIQNYYNSNNLKPDELLDSWLIARETASEHQNREN